MSTPSRKTASARAAKSTRAKKPALPAAPPVNKGVRSLTLREFLSDFAKDHADKDALPFCFILGAGASKESGAPMSEEIIDKYLLPDLQQSLGGSGPLKKWATSKTLGIPGFTWDRRGEWYTTLYHRVFHRRPEAGSHLLERLIGEAQPSYGYAVLAQLLQLRHNVIITTNFDHLASDAVFQFGGKAPFVCGHESLAGYIPKPTLRPVIIKVHRDLHLDPQNTKDGTSSIAENLRRPLQRFLEDFTPVFIGYAGNDGSLMTFLNSLPPGSPRRAYWCEMENKELSPSAKEFLEKDGRFLVPMQGFDRLLFDLHQTLALPPLIKELENANETRRQRLLAGQKKLSRSLEEYVTWCETHLGPDSPETAAALYDHAASLYDQIRYREAEPLFRRALDIQTRKLGADDPAALQTRHFLGWLLYPLGRYRDAETELRPTVAARVRVLGEEHPLTLSSRNNLANALQAQGKNAEAEAEHRAVLAVRERVLGLVHPDTLTSRNNLAIALRTQGKNAEAEAENRAVLAVRERVLGPEHSDTLQSRNNLAITLLEQGKNAEAEAENRAVLAGRERVSGPEHPDTLACRNNLAAALWAQGKHAEAEAEHRARITIEERVLGPEHPDTLASHFNLALSLETLGDEKAAAKDHKKARRLWEDALSHAQTAQRAGERVLGKDHPQQKAYETEVNDLQKKLAKLEKKN